MEENREAVQRMQDYIEKHIGENISQADLARASNYSPWYSYRLFIKFTNLSPADYIRRLRLSKSAMKLRDEKIKVADAAFELGFKSVDGYQRAFLREFGCNPKEYADNPVPIYLFTPYGAAYRAKREEKKMDEVKNIFIQLIEKPKRKVIIKRGIKAKDYFSYCDEVGCDVWGLLRSIKGGEALCLWLPEKYVAPGTSQYVQGAEVDFDYSGTVPAGFDIIELPQCKYLMFQGEPFEEINYCEAIEQVWEAIKKYDPKLIGYEWDKENPRIQLEPIGTRGYIELLPVKK
ncbi:MAG: AraC family transcriptional regulator [Candidatus Metalachnospira sp.]|nr:AraC family transcriptional regulator [Candidatus Metalachnospira sp.]